MKVSSVIGIDLSGPRNLADTCVAVFAAQPDNLSFQRAIHGASDQQIYHLVSNLGTAEPVVVGIDAPLSYNPAGGDRPSDKELRRLEIGRASCRERV